MRRLEAIRHTPGRPFRMFLAAACVATFTVMSVGWLLTARAQTFDSGSDGSDGALNLTTPDTIDFDPDALGLDADHDNIYRFTTITIAAGVTVRLSGARISGPVIWLASGEVQIDGALRLDALAGKDNTAATTGAERLPSVPGAGGYGGGIGGYAGGVPPQPGRGPGGGLTTAAAGGGGGYGSQGAPGRSCGSYGNDPCGNGGPAYGSLYLVPVLGGSGGSGGSASGNGDPGGGGGAGGGAILIASSVSVTVNGTVSANGGAGGIGGRVIPASGYPFPSAGGGGSGGAIRIVAPSITGTGRIEALGGTGGRGSSCSQCLGDGGNGAGGRIRLEDFQHHLPGTVSPAPVVASPVSVFLEAQPPPPSLRVVYVDTTPVTNPAASLIMPDVTIEANAPVAVTVEARNIPVGATVELRIVSENAPDQILTSSPLVGTSALSTATVTVDRLPPGFSRGFLHATWGQ